MWTRLCLLRLLLTKHRNGKFVVSFYHAQVRVFYKNYLHNKPPCGVVGRLQACTRTYFVYRAESVGTIAPRTVWWVSLGGCLLYHLLAGGDLDGNVCVRIILFNTA